MRRVIFLLFVFIVFLNIKAYGASELTVVTEGRSGEDYFLSKGCRINYSPGDYEVVGCVARMLRDDIERVTGVAPDINDSASQSSDNEIIIGTLGKSTLINSLVERGMIDGDAIRDGLERFLIKTLQDEQGRWKLIIAGSDRRGTAFGVTTLSRALGVSPWVWWGDVPVDYCPEIGVRADYISDSPTIKYRGIFINDEDWGLLPWAAGNFEKEVGDIGPETYGKVCELILRLRGNMLAPAMHSCTGAFYSHPESKIVADRYGIIMTTSHCEPMMFNNAAKSEWNPARDGDWDYGTNRDVIYNKFVSRLDEAAQYENIYTIGMRGVHDEAMSRERPVEEKIALLESVISDQRELLQRKLGRPANEIAQIFVPYKETLDLYRRGLNVPEDVTIIWPDDNYGYMKSVSSPAERKRSGGSGVYYHTSYLGTPHDYLWVCTTPPAMMYHELRKAYSCGADRYWLLNVGDIKPAELDTQTFFDMAWDFSRFDYDNANRYQAQLLAEWFGDQYKDRLQDILDEFYRLAWIRKPEYMGWEIEWDSPDRADTGPTEFSFTNYGDAVKRLSDYSELAAKTRSIMEELPDSLKSPFFEILGYPVLASDMMNRKFLYAQLNGELASAGEKEGANHAARLSEEAANEIDRLTERYNSLEDGKWKGMMSVPPGYCAKYQERPKLMLFPDCGEKEVKFNIRNEEGFEPGCKTLDLRKAEIDVRSKSNGNRLIEGIGYDGYILRLGEPDNGGEEPMVNEAVLKIDDLKGDSVRLQVFHLPFFPLYEGKRCRIGISVDGGEEKVIEYLPEEWSKQWKENVLRNSALSEVTVPIDRSLPTHELRMRGIDSGMAIQRIVIDTGGMRPGYVGPDL